MPNKNATYGGKLQKHEKKRKKKKDKAKKNFDLNGKYTKKTIRKVEELNNEQKIKYGN